MDLTSITHKKGNINHSKSNHLNGKLLFPKQFMGEISVTDKLSAINGLIFHEAKQNIRQIKVVPVKQREPDKVIEACSSKPAPIQKNSQSFSTMDAAGKQAIRKTNPLSIKNYREYGGSICEENGKFSYSHPNIGIAGCVQGSSCPTGTKLVGDYHTHGGPTTKYNVEEFSQQDWLSNEIQRITGYLGTPSGEIKKYTPAWDNREGHLYPAKTETIGTGAK